MNLKRLKEIEERFKELTNLLSQPQSEASFYKRYAKERADLEPIVNTFNDYRKIENELSDLEEMAVNADDEELKALALEEIEGLKSKWGKLGENLKLLLIPKEINDDKNAIMEIRAGTGGEEAALFAADLFRMYNKYVQAKGWKVELMSSHPTGMGGFKEVIFGVSGQGGYGRLRYESGGHRVQRVPATETSGRIHTSAVTVAVLPEADEVDIQIKPEEIRLDVFRSSGPGGQSVNTTDSAVRITHLSSGLVVSCQDERSQHKNRAKAMRILRARLLDKVQQEEKTKQDEARRQQVGSGDRSEKIRTYNYPQNRVTDHRIGLSLHKLDLILEGELDELITALIVAEREEQIKKVS